MHKKMVHQLLLKVLIVLLLLYRTTSAPGFISGVEGAKVKCKEKERQALLKLKQEVIDPYGVLSSWRGSNCCMWRGVGCNNITGHVTVLDLHGEDGEHINSYLIGNISSSLLELRHLSYLDLSNNDLSMGLPSVIGSLTELRYLSLSGTSFVGTLPYQLGNLSKLQTLDLGHNSDVYFERLDWLSHLSSLEHLDLSTNNLSKANDWLQGVSNLPHLNTLHLSDCSLSTIIPSSFSFTNCSKSLSVLDLSFNDLPSSIYAWLNNFSDSLVDLDLSGNMLESIPDAFKNMIFLESLNLFSNNLQSIPRFFGEMCNLNGLDLSFNSLNGLLSETIQNLGCAQNSLEILSLRDNNLYGSLPDITRFSSLRELDLSFNQLNGSLSSSFRQRSNILSLKLQGNQFTGSLPDLTVFPSLNSLSINDNRLDGTVSETIGSLYELEYLDLSRNSLQGMLNGSHFSSLTKLRNLVLSYNPDLSLEFRNEWISPFQLDTLSLRSCNLGPLFPKWLQTQTNISQLDISSAGISDIIPDWFWDLSPNLIFSNLSHNQLSGILPNNLSSRYPAFIGFDLSSNNFKGPIPPFPSKTTALDLSNNMFSGSISFICEIEDGSLDFLDLSNNLLSGSIPDCFTQLQYLSVLILGNNNLSGEIPSSIGSLPLLRTLSLRNNSLHGELPSLKNCSSLEFLDLSENRLSGEIPAWVGESLSELEFLSLQSNEFFGSILPHLCQLTLIQILDLSLNNLSGSIPKCLNNLTAMVEKVEEEVTVDENNYCVIVMKTSTEEALVYHYINKALVEWKGRQFEYERNLDLLRLIDFSGNKLSGEIPDEITNLLLLMELNFSRNELTGVIPQRIGQLKQLESLDLSRNQLSGAIPMTMADLDFLNNLDLSYNELSGKIPSSTQLQSFDASSFAGNLALCGPPLSLTCPWENMPERPPTNEENVDEFKEWFYIGLITGFSASFCGVLGALLLKTSWRHSSSFLG